MPRGLTSTQNSLLSQSDHFLFLLAAASLGSLERVDFSLLGLSCLLGMGGKVARARLPLEGRIGIAVAVPSRRQFRDSLTPFALFNYLLTGAPVESAARLGHEPTLRSRLYCRTNHDKHLRI